MIIPSNSKVFFCFLFLFACDKVRRIDTKNVLRVLFLALNICKLFFFYLKKACRENR